MPPWPPCRKPRPDLVIAELRLTPMNGLELLRRIRQHDPQRQRSPSPGFPPDQRRDRGDGVGGLRALLRKDALDFELRPVVEAALRTQDAIRSASEQTRQGELRAEDYVKASSASPPPNAGGTPR